MTKILLTRHGHVEGLLPERFRGLKDLALTAKGVAQAAALAQRISREWHPSAIYTSPLQRAAVTAKAIAAATKAPCQMLKSLTDLNYGAWQWQTFDEVRSHSPSLFALWHFAPHLVRFPKGDSLQDLLLRAADTIRFILEHHHDDTVVLVGHDSVNRAILLQILDQPASAYWRLAQDPCALNELEVTQGHSRVVRMNDVSHLASVTMD
ncbi:MAG TPA: histidine phosphatase family protein [Methylocella sp.]|nr:histidine phosphatase family protein [Methylocella sp.]